MVVVGFRRRRQGQRDFFPPWQLKNQTWHVILLPQHEFGQKRMKLVISYLCTILLIKFT